jgi:hypothetical protein
MKGLMRFVVLCVLVCPFASLSFGQAISSAAMGASSVNPSYAQKPPVSVSSLPAGISPNSLVLDAATGAVVGGASGKATTNSLIQVNPLCQPTIDDRFNTDNALPNQSNIDGLNTLATFDGAFVAQAGPEAGGDFRFTMIGNDPRLGHPTVFPACIDEVSLQLLNADGSVFATVPFGPFEKATLESPNFEPLSYRSGGNVEYADAVHRAQFFNVMKNNWHTLLMPSVTARTTMTIPRFVNIQLKDGSIITARSYFTGTAADGSTFVLMLNILFNALFENEVVNQINQGNFVTSGINMTLFPNTFLFSLNTANPNAPGNCCTLGFHTYFLDGVFPESRWVTQYASWISPGIFNGGFQDVTALSHETSEAFANPFVSNPAPNWQFPGQPAGSKVCQANLEEGDPIEVLPNATATVEVKEKGFHFFYHPQNIPLLQWFEMGTTSGAIDGAFSFPDETVLTQSAIPCPQ